MSGPPAVNHAGWIVAGLALVLISARAVVGSAESPGIGASGMPEPLIASLLVDYFEAFLRDSDIEAFRRNVSARYTEGTLCRLVRSENPQARRAAVLALGLIGGDASNAVVAGALRDDDATVRDLAVNALWSIWFRADTAENNAALRQVHDLNSRRMFGEAIERANRLIVKAPRFAEAYNQRAIALFSLERFTESASDCRRALERNPYHIGALSGLGQCHLRLGRRDEAIAVFREALRLQPRDDGLRRFVADLEAD